MKKILAIFLVLQFLLGSIIVANGNLPTTQMTMDGKLVSFYVVQLKLNDQLIKSDVPPVVHNERTLVPLRAIMENVNAEVEWDQANYQVTVKTVDKQILLKIDSPVAMVNGQAVRLPDNVPPKIINGRTMVPIRFVAETIGMNVTWEENTRTVVLSQKSEEVPVDPNEEPKTQVAVKDISVASTQGFTEIRIKTTGSVSYDELTLVNPTRLIFDLKDTKFELVETKKLLANGTYSTSVSNSAVKEVRLSQFNRDPFVTRVVIEMNSSANHKVSFDEQTSEFVIQFQNFVKSVKTEKMNTKEVIIIEGDDIRDYNILQLENPKRLVVDIKNAFLSSKDAYQVSTNGTVAKNIRVAQFTPDQHYQPSDKIVRVVIDLQELPEYPEFYYEVKGNQLLVHVEGKPYNQLSYEETGWTTSKLVFKGEGASRYLHNKNAENVLEVLIPKSGNALEFSDIKINDHMIKDIKVDSTNKEFHWVRVTLEKDVNYSVLKNNNTNELVLELKNANRYREILVIIDPGHGGTDPGAISTLLKMKESELVLDVSHRLNKLLQDAGFRTYMTRSTDTFITLQDRVGVANQLKGDLFVSVHANAVGRAEVNGIENLYYPSENNPNDSRDNKRLAQIFQTEMTTRLGAHSRGIVPREQIYVLRETKMPAVLTEMGFLTNPDEEKKLSTDAYRQRVAESLFNSIVKYFEETKFKK